MHGIYLRGGVTVGLHCHSQYIDYGPALTEAVHLEKTRAGATTRIVLSTSLQQDLRAFGTKRLPIVEDLGDNSYFLNFLGALDQGARAALRSQIQLDYNEANKSGNASVLQKLAWLASYFNWYAPCAESLEFSSIHSFRELS
jgi:hypothetical protein